MEVGKSYSFAVKRHGVREPVTYRGQLLRKTGDTLWFWNLENTCTIKIDRGDLAKDSEPQEITV